MANSNASLRLLKEKNTQSPSTTMVTKSPVRFQADPLIYSYPLQASASKLPILVSLDLFENGIRDEGALVNDIQGQLAAGDLAQVWNAALDGDKDSGQ